MAKKINFLLLLCTISIISFAQTSSTSSTQLTPEQKKEQRKEHLQQMMKEEEEGALVYHRQNGFGIKLNTDGLSFLYEHGKYKTITKTNLWWVELGERHDKKEDSQSSGSYADGSSLGNPFKYGKINNFYYLKLGIGQQLLIGGKGNPNGVAVSFIYGGGLSLGMLKPYYLTVAGTIQDPYDSTTLDVTNQQDIRYSSSTANQFLGSAPDSVILGSTGFGKGLNEITFVPGLHARVALRFDYARFKQTLSAIEVGVNAEYYTQNMPIMALENPSKFFFNGYVAFVFGGRK
jgi:hypothetical protein